MFSTSAGNFYCSPVQDQLRHSLYTKNVTGYAGALKTMKALADSDLQTYNNTVLYSY